MTSTSEGKLPKYIDHPYDRFMMIRLEFLILCQNELEAKILRIIEWSIEQERNHISRTSKASKTSDELWVPISYSFFMDCLFGTVQSLATLKEAITSLEEKKLIAKDDKRKKKYDAIKYTVNRKLIAKIFKTLPPIEKLDMVAIMKQPRKPRQDKNGQLIVSKIDPLVQNIQKMIDDDLEYQKLIDSRVSKIDTMRVSKIDTMTELGEYQKLIPLIREEESSNKNTEEEEGVDSQEQETTHNDSSCSSSQNIKNKNLGNEGAQQPTQQEENREGEKKGGVTPTPRIVSPPEYAPETHQLAEEIAAQVYISVSPHLLKVVETYRTTPDIDLKMIASEALDFIQSARNKKKTQMSASFLERSIKFQIEKATTSPVPGSSGLSYSTGLQSHRTVPVSDGYTPEERLAILDMTPAERKEFNQKRRAARELLSAGEGRK